MTVRLWRENRRVKTSIAQDVGEIIQVGALVFLIICILILVLA